MAIPLLGLLAVQGARTIATRIAGSAATRRKVANILAKNFKKAQKESLGKGKIPTDKTLTQGLTKDQKGLLSNLTPKTTSQVPGQPINLLDKTPTASTFGQRIGTGGERIVLPRRGYTQRYSDAGKLLPVTRGSNLPVPVGQNAAIANQANASISRAAINAQKQAAAREAAKQATMAEQRYNKYLTGAGLTSLSLPLLVGGGQQEEEPQPTPQPVPAVPTDPRLMQVINPSYESTSKELLNSALLRAGLSMASGGNLKNIVDSAASVGDFETKFRTGEEAFAAGRRNLGEAAKIYVSQDEDGFYKYTGSQEGSPEALLKSFMGEGGKKENIGQGRMITPEIIAKFKSLPKNINISDEELIKELLSMGFVEGEMV